MSCSNCGFNSSHTSGNSFTNSKAKAKPSTIDWHSDLPYEFNMSDLVEVKFKNNRKEFFRNKNQIRLAYNEAVTVQAQFGHDVGLVSLRGLLAEMQFKRKSRNADPENLRIIYRKANVNDLQKWQECKVFESSTLIRSRQIISKLNLNMKLSDVEYQGDKTRATFYYIADERVDFRELIKMLAAEFKITVEMKQIGVRQEAAKIGGLGTCGKELCCSTWRNELTTVPTSTIQLQNLSPHAEKYLGKCGKLKCCLTYELASYIEAQSDFPSELLELETKQGIAYPYKTDILRKTVWYTFKSDLAHESPIEVTIDRIREIIAMNKRGKKADNLVEDDKLNHN